MSKKQNKPNYKNEHLATKTEAAWGTRCSQITTLWLRAGRRMGCVKREENLLSRSFFSSSFSVFLSIRLQLLRSRMKFPAIVTSTSSSWQENQNLWKEVLQLRDFSKIIFHVRETRVQSAVNTIVKENAVIFDFRFIYRQYLDADRENRSSDKSTWWVNSEHCSLTANRFWCRVFPLV